MAFEVRQRPRGIVGSGTEPDGSGSREGLRLFERDRRSELGHGVGRPLAEDVLSDFRGLSPRKAVAFPAGAPPSRPDNSGSSAPTDEKCSFQLPFF